MALNTEKNNEHWKRAFIGPLSNDFLRLSTPREIQEAADRQAAIALQQQQQVYTQFLAPNIVGRLSITVAQAKLVKNYGLSRMDPYVRIRVGHFVYETQTDPNGGKNPRWNRVIHSQLPSGVNSVYLDIYDECNFTMDELVAWAEIKIPEAVLRGETHEDWYPLSGKQGEGLEGMIDLVLSFNNNAAVPAPAPAYMYQPVAPVMMVPNVAGRPMPVFVAPAQAQAPAVVMQQQQQQQQLQLHQQQQQQQQQQQMHQQIQQPQQPQISPPLTEQDLQQIQEMFPSIDKEVIKSVSEANRNSREATINSLLQMTN